MKLHHPQVAADGDIHGYVLIGTITGDTIIVEQYSAHRRDAIAGPLLHCLESVWQRLPDALAEHGKSRFDFLIRQQVDDGELIDLFYASGLDAGRLFANVARRMIKVRAVALSQLKLPERIDVRVLSSVESDALHDFIEWTAPAPTKIDQSADVDAWATVGARSA